MPSAIIKNMLTGKSNDGKVFDSPAYENALKESGYTNEEARAYWAPRQDPFSQESLSDYVSSQVPKVSIENNNVVISAPEEVLKTPFVSQLQKELSNLKGVDLNNSEVRNAIDQINKEIQANYTESLKETIGWTPEEYTDYQRAIQATSTTNPMKSSDYLKWGPDGNPITDEEGKIIVKTPEEWIAYWRENYNADERTDLFKKSLQSGKPYERTMALVMAGPGGTRPVYGYSQGERIGQFFEAAQSEMGRFPEGLFRLLGEDNNTKRVESLQKETEVPVESLRKFDITNEDEFNSKIGNISGRTWSDLSDDEKAFVLLVGVAKENSMIRDADKGILRDSRSENLKNMSSPSEYYSRTAIEGILKDASFDKYKEIRDNYDTWQGYEDWTEEDDERLAKNAIWSGVASNAGRVAGVIGRFLWENAVIKGATGGISAKSLLNPKLVTGSAAKELAGRGLSMNRISDNIGAKIVTWINDKKIPLLSKLGQNTLTFGARLLGTIPEDILQMAVDNVVTYNSDENENLLNPTQLSDNFKNNLIIMTIFNAARVGVNQVRLAKFAKQMEKAAELNAPLNISGIVTDADDLTRAINRGEKVVVDNNEVSVVDASGNKKVLENITPEQGKMVQQSLFNYEAEKAPEVSRVSKTEVNEPGSMKNVETESQRATIEIETPDGAVRVEAPDYRFRNRKEVLNTNPEPTRAALTQYHNRGVQTLMEDFANAHLPEFQNKFGDVQVSDFDWALWNTKKGLKPEQIVGTTDPTTGREFTQNMADAIKWFGEQPFMKDLRLASRDAQGMEGDFNLFGYLPHTVYDPSNVSFEEALNGRGSLWEPFTGASMLDENNVYKGFGGDFESRYRTFASNMLWDAKAKDIAASKVIEEAQMEGMDLTPEQAIKVADGAEALQKSVDNATTTKEVVNGLTSDGDTDFDKITKNTAKDAEKLGLGQSTHDNWGEVYFGKDSSSITKQRRGIVNSLDTQANFLRNTQTRDGSMYDNGAADIVYSYGNAVDIISRYMDPNDATATNLRDAIVDYYTNHGRPKKYAEIYADKAMSRLGSVPGQLTKAKAIESLANSMKWEAWSRLRRWIVRADYKQFNTSTKKHIDQFLFNHMQMESIKGNQKISQKLTKALETATGLRYRAIFYGNIKNALLQTSELNRYFSVFKWGDVAQMAKRLATDDKFRARVNTYVDIVAPKTAGLEADLYGNYSTLADNMEVEKTGVKFKDLGKKAVETADAIGLAPIEKAEAFKNRMMIAGLVQEADRLGLSGDEALRHIRKRFERVALAVDEMGRIGMSSNPLARTMLFLQNFQIRELGMHLYNILDETGMAKSTPKSIINATKYLTKVLGAKLATTLILARVGYSASQTLGLDPFGLLDDYNQMDKEDMNWVDQQIAGGLLTPFFSGGMASLIGDMYFMARKAYEDSVQQTVSDEVEEKINDTWGLAVPEDWFTWENMIEGAKNFVPGNVLLNRMSQMGQILDTGWATSASGNKMYTAPTDPLNIALGYIFGRSATQNALQYNQAYGDNLFQTLGRFNPFRNYQEFDPIDTENYSDWFKGNADDLQQFNKGRYWFQDERDRILDEYQAVIGKSYASDDEIAEAEINMNRKLDDLYEKLDRFVDAYEKKNGTITSAMVKQILGILNTGRNIVGESEEERRTRQNEERDKALERYSRLGLSPVGTYTGPSVRYPETEAKYQGSPQYRAAVSGYYNIADEATRVLKLADEELAPIRKEIQNRLSYAYSTEDWDTIENIQKEYLRQFDQVVAPIIAAYGNSILSSTDVANQLNDMLSTGTNKRSGNLIPSSTYAKNKRGRYQSMPYERVDVSKWAQQRYRGNTYKQPTINSWSTVEEDLQAIRDLANSGRARRARARALELKARVENQQRSLSKEDYDWLTEFLNNGGNK